MNNFTIYVLAIIGGFYIVKLIIKDLELGNIRLVFESKEKLSKKIENKPQNSKLKINN